MTKPYKCQAIKVTSAINLSQEEVDKAHDIACLEKIHELIDEFITPQDSNEDKRLILFQIGLQANKIKYNDASSNYIRNQYGLIDRNNNNAIRKNGLEIHYLQALEFVYPSLEVVNDTWNERAEIWQDNLKIVQKKIGLILNGQKHSNSKSAVSFAKFKKPEVLIADIKELYCEELTKKLQDIVKDSDLPSLDFQHKADRYCFANSLLKTGELCREVIDFLNPGQESGLFSIFKKMRNELVHNMNVMSDDLDEQQMHDLNKIRDILTGDFAVTLERFQNTKRIELLDQDQKSHYNGLIKSIVNKAMQQGQSSLLIEDHLMRGVEEIRYLRSIDSTDKKRQDAILEFGTTKVAQCLNKINAKSDADLAFFLDSAQILQESWNHSIVLRNTRIAHGVMRTQDDDKCQDIQDFVTSMEEGLIALYNVYSLTKSNLSIPERAANSFFDRNSFLNYAKGYVRLGQLDQAIFILEECVKGYENETPLIAISQDNTLFDIIDDVAQHNNFFRDILERGYCELSKTDHYYQLRQFFDLFMNRSFESDLFRQEMKQGSSVIDAINGLPEDENQQMRMLLALPYFSTQHQILSELCNIYSSINDTEQLHRPLAVKIDLETKIYGHALQLSLIEQANLLQKKGNEASAHHLIENAASMHPDLPIIQAESLINMAEILAKDGNYEQAKEKLAMANAIIPTSSESLLEKIMTLLRVAETEALDCKDSNQAIFHLKQADMLMQENRAILRSHGPNMQVIEELFVKSGTNIMSEHILQMKPRDDVIDNQTIDVLGKIGDMAVKIHHNTDRYGNRSHIIKSFVDVLHAGATICFDKPHVRADLIKKADDINELYDTKSSALSNVTVLSNIALGFRQTVDGLKNRDKNVSHSLDKLLDNMIRFSQIKADPLFSQQDIPPEITDFLEKYFVRLVNIEKEPEKSLALVEKYQSFKSLYGLPESRNDLFLQASCKFNLPVNAEENAKKALVLVTKAKSLPSVPDGVDDYILDDFRGTVYFNIKEFSQAIRAYNCAKNSTDDERLKQEAQASINNVLQASRKNTSKSSGMSR